MDVDLTTLIASFNVPDEKLLISWNELWTTIMHVTGSYSLYPFANSSFIVSFYYYFFGFNL